MRLAWIAVLFVSIHVSTAHAQDIYRGTDSGGLQPLRAYFAPTSFERFDTKSGNLFLTFTDFVLPGYPGHNGAGLALQRTYNNDWVASPLNAQDTWRWSWGFPGMVMRVIDPAWPVSDAPFTSLEAEIARTPTFVMADGSLRRTTYAATYVPGDAASQRWTVAAMGFTNYDRQYRILYMPDGTIAQYDTLGRLQIFHDGLGNHVALTYTTNPSQITVTQTIGAQSRVVVLDLDGNGSVTKMTYQGREWQYVYGPDGMTQASPPVGPPWQFAYDNRVLSRVTLPGGALIDYGYQVKSYNWGTARVLSTRTTGGTGVTDPGTWQFFVDYTQTERLSPVTEITMPLGATLRYENFDPQAPGELRLGGGTGFLTATRGATTLQTGEWRTREERQYTTLPLKSGDPYGPATLAQQVTRERDPGAQVERQWTRTYTYRTTDMADYHHVWKVDTTRPDGPPIRTTFSYLHRTSQDHMMLGLPATEQTVVDPGQQHLEISDRQWVYGDTNWRLPTAARDGQAWTTFTRDALGHVASIQLPNGKTTTFTYTWGQLQTTEGQEPGTTVTRAIDPDGSVVSETAAGRTTSFQYDDLGRVTDVQGPGSTNAVTTSYDDVGASSVTTARGTSSVTTLLDGFGRPLEVVDASGIRSRVRYDAEGRIRYESYPFNPSVPPGKGNQDIGTTITYDDLGRVKRRTEADGIYTEWTYGLTTVSVRDRTNDRVTTMTYGPHGVIGLTDPAKSEWTYDYNDAGHLEALSHGGVTRSWAYDAAHRLVSETSPEAGTVTYLEYDAAGLLTQKQDARNTLFQYTYDGNNRLTRVSAGTLSTLIDYEAGSSLVSRMTTSGGTMTAYAYDGAGRPIAREDSVDGKVLETQYAYDANDNLTRITYPSGRTVGYEYDAHDRLARVYDIETGLNYATAFDYHGSGALTGFTSGNGIPTAVTLDTSRYRVSTIDAGPLQLTYQYDAGGSGNVSAISDTNRTGMDQSFAYDVLDRLAYAAGGGSGQSYGATFYTYDAHGNRQTDTVNAPAYTFDYHPGKPFHLQNIAGTGNYQYDDNGNLISGSPSGASFTHQYRPDNMMDSSTVAGQTTTYAYDAEMARIKKSTVNGATTYFGRGPDGRVLTEWTVAGGADPVARDYIYAGGRVIAAVTKTNASLPSYGVTLAPQQQLLPDERLVSADGRFTLWYQPDGNLVLYYLGVGPLWARGTAGAAPNRVVMQDTGNLVMYDAAWNAVWSTPTQGNPGASLTMQNDGNAVIYAADGVTPLWHTYTYGH